MTTPIQPVPDVILASEFPSLADRPAGTYNAKAKAWADSENAMVTRARETALVGHNNAVVATEQAVIATNKTSEANDAKLGAEAASDTALMHKQGAKDAEDSAWAAAAALGADPDLFPQPLEPGKVLGAIDASTVGWIDAVTRGDVLLTTRTADGNWIESGGHYLQSDYAELFDSIGLIHDIPVGLEFTPLPPPSGVYGNAGGALREVIELSDGTLLTCATLPGANGAIYRSIDGGDTWGTVLSTSGHSFWGIAALTDETIVAASVAGGNSFVYRSTDGGLNWGGPVTLSGLAYASGIAAASETTAVVVGTLTGSGGGGPGLFRSVDGGVTWTQILLGITSGSGLIKIRNVGDGIVIAVGATNRNYRSIDYGATWASFSLAGGVNFNDVNVTPSGTVVAVGAISGTIPMTYVGISTDSGNSWDVNVVAMGTNMANTSSVICVSDNLLIIPFLSTPKATLRSTDGGKTWRQVGAIPSDVNSINAAVVSSGRLICVGTPSNTPGGTGFSKSEPRYDYDTDTIFWVPDAGSAPEPYRFLVKAK